MGVAECQRRIDSAEFVEWLAYSRLEPFGEERDDLRAAMIACTVANSMRSRKRAYKVDDFMFDFDKPPQSKQNVANVFLNAMQSIHAQNQAGRRARGGNR